MTIIVTPVTIQSGGETAEYFRRMFYAEMGGRPGVLGALDMVVTQNGTPNMTVNVADGRCFVLGSESSTQGLYFLDNRNTQNVAVGASHATLGRYDIIVARVRDATYSGAVNSAALECIAGTPAASPVVPATPNNCLVLARVLVNPAVTSITTAVIDDTRTGNAGYTSQSGRAAALGGIIPCSSSFRPTVALYDGMMAYEGDADRFIVYNGSAWVEYGRVSAFDSSFTPTITQSIGVSKTVSWSRYNKIGRWVNFQTYLQVTSTGTSNQPIRVSLPFTAATTALPCGSFYWFAGPAATAPNANTNWLVTAHLATTTQVGALISNTPQQLGQTQAGWPEQLRGGDALLIDIAYEAAA